MGVVGFWRTEGRPFTDTERAIMDRFTRLISIMVLGDEASESTRHLVDRLRLTGEAARALSASLDPSQVVQAIVERIAELVDVDRITVTKFWSDSVEAIAGYDKTKSPARIGTTWGLTPELRAAIDSGELAFEAFSDLPGMPTDMQEQLSDVRTRVLLPLRAGGRVLGMLAVSRRSDQAFAHLDLEILEQIAMSAAFALQNASLFAETKEAQQKALHALLAVSDHLDATSSDVDLYARFAETVAELVDARRVTLWRISSDGTRLMPAAGAHGVPAKEFERLRAVPCNPHGTSPRDRVASSAMPYSEVARQTSVWACRPRIRNIRGPMRWRCHGEQVPCGSEFSLLTNPSSRSGSATTMHGRCSSPHSPQASCGRSRRPRSASVPSAMPRLSDCTNTSSAPGPWRRCARTF